MSDTVKAFVTRQALTSGTRVVEGYVSPNDPRAFVVVHGQDYRERFGHGEWHRDWPAAVAKADAMRARRVVQLRREIDRLQALRFPTELP